MTYHPDTDLASDFENPPGRRLEKSPVKSIEGREIDTGIPR